MATLNIVELGGDGGIYQHVLGAAMNGTYSSWDRVVLHTSRDAESYPAIPRLEYHRCMRWQRSGPSLWRRMITIAWVLLAFLPHLIWASFGRVGAWEVQGQFARGLYVFFVLIPKLAGRQTFFAPHNSFPRHGGFWEAPIIRYGSALADATIVYVASEALHFPAAQAIECRALWQYVPEVNDEAREFWRRRLAGERPTVLSAGQLRVDKNPLLLMEAVNGLEFPVNLLFAGQDKGAAELIHKTHLHPRHRLIVEDRYLDLADLVAAMEVADVVVCPYQVASQSGVVALANQLGRPVIVSSAGGLSEQSARSFALGEDQANQLSRALGDVLARPHSK